MRITSFVNEGLGHTSYLIDLDNGTALVIDPARLPIGQRAEATRIGLDIVYTADTHSHADYISGSPELAVGGATFVAPAAAALQMPHRGVGHGDAVDLGHYRLQALATPGHTPEHLAYLIIDDGTPVALFSGGSLMVGTVGRTDLVSDDTAEPLARAMYRSLHEHILTLPEDLAVYPTHGAGSFCSAPGSAERTTTIGRERATSPLLQARDEDDFVELLVGGLGSFPSYFRRLPALNQRGVAAHDHIPPLRLLSPDEVAKLHEQGAYIVDARMIQAFATAHLPGSVSIQLRPVFATWLGWLMDPDRSLVFVLDDDQDEADLVSQCLTVGLDHLAGRLDGGIQAWVTSGRPAGSLPLIEPADLDDTRTVLDVRQHNEYLAGHIPGAHNIELGVLPSTPAPDSPLLVMCGHGERAMTAASLLTAGGHDQVSVFDGGPDTWSAAAGRNLEVGP